MLHLTRQAGEAFYVREPSLVTVLRVLPSGKVKLAIEPWDGQTPENRLTASDATTYDDGRKSPQRRQ